MTINAVKMSKLLDKHEAQMGIPVDRDHEAVLRRYRKLYSKAVLSNVVVEIETTLHLDMMGDPIPGFGFWFGEHYIFEAGFSELSAMEVYARYNEDEPWRESRYTTA